MTGDMKWISCFRIFLENVKNGGALAEEKQMIDEVKRPQRGTITLDLSSYLE